MYKGSLTISVLYDLHLSEMYFEFHLVLMQLKKLMQWGEVWVNKGMGV